MKVLFAPDYRNGNPYQSLLAAALEAEGVRVDFLQNYRRIMPLSRSLISREFDLLHLHWPEAYFPEFKNIFDIARIVRFPIDLSRALRGRRFVVTAHNLLPHNRRPARLIRHSLRRMFQMASGVIAHSQVATEKVADTFHISTERITVIPHGDLSVSVPVLPNRLDARRKLGWETGKHCLMFGALSPYKGIEETADWWERRQPGPLLWILGKAWDASYEAALKSRLAEMTSVRLVPQRSDEQTLAEWITAADAVIFNHQSGVLTSGAACLARSLGTPIVLPTNLDSIDLMEPSPQVFRFDSLGGNFISNVYAACKKAESHALDPAWLQRTSWTRVAKMTAALYQSINTR